MRLQRVLVLGLGGLCAVAAFPALAGEGVDLSRYKLTIQVAGPPGPAISFGAIDPAVLDEFCRDDDGCAMSIKATSAVGPIHAWERRLYIQQTSDRWVTTFDLAFGTDNDTFSETAGEITFDEVTCTVGDGDAVGSNSDTGVGFGLVLQTAQAGSKTCTLVLTD